MAGKVITDFIRMQLFKKGGAIANDKAVQFSANALEKRLINLGVDPNSINNQTQLKQLLAYVKQAEDQQFNQLFSTVLSGDEAAKFLNKAFPKKGEVVKFPQKRSFKEEIEAMKKSGDIVDEDNMVISEKITDREMFKDASKRFNQTDVVADSIARITSMEPVAAMKEANKIIKREGIYKNLNKNQSQKILKDTDDWINQRDPSDLYDYNKNRPFRDDPNFDPDDPDYNPEDMAKGGRAGYQTGNQVMPAVDARMQNSYDYNVRRNNAERTLNQMSRNYDFSGLSALGLNAKTYDSTPGPMRGIPAVKGMREKMIQDIMGRTQSGYTPAPKPKPKTYRTVSPEAQALNMSQSTYEDIIRSGKDPKQYYMDYQNRLMTAGGNYGTPGTSSYTGPPLLKYGQVIGAPGMMGGIAGPGMGPGATPPTQAQINQMMQTNPAGYADFADLVKQYSADPYKGLQEEIKDVVGGRDTGYMSAQDYYDVNVLGLDGQGIAEKYGLEYAKGGRAGYYTGGMVDVEPNLSDIGHGSDALMARTRLVSPDSQATTSTGLNYLLAEDNDNIRVPFAGGKSFSESELLEFNKAIKEKIKKGGRSNMPVIDPEEYKKYLESFKTTKAAEGGRIGFSDGGMGRRAFLKLLATLGGGIAGIKSGLFGMGGKEATKKAVSETVKQSVGKGTPPPYFFELMETISKNGKEIKSYGERIKQTVAPSKDGKSELLMTEDLNTGSVQIKKIHKEGDDMITKSEEMTYTKNMGDESTKGKPADDYEEVTEYNSRIYKDEFNEPDFVDGIDVESIVKEVDVNPQDVGKVKYEPRANGGRIGFSGGNLAKFLAGKKITSSSGRFLEKVFGKEGFKEMTKNDPAMYRGLLEVVEMFRKRDKEGLKMYMQKFLPHMDDATVEDFIIGSGGTEGIEGQLIRLGSGRDYAGKLEMMKKLENVKKLDNLDVTEEMIRKPNASGGIQTMLGE